VLKRTFDLAFAVVALVLLSPVLAAIGALVFLNLGRPIMFKQQRPGLHGVPFLLIKFRTMRGGPGSDEERLTRFGRALRATSLDELPELWNVLAGDMSLVGPRPLLMEYLSLYTPEQARRHEVRPGITGLAQVNGRNLLSWDEKFAMDIWYVDNRSFWLDISVLGRTLLSIFRREGIAAENEATMPKFTGRHG
jgi:lipopolysaccharide/colanic/teichoic acid biosynthesis glycosyltransferase